MINLIKRAGLFSLSALAIIVLADLYISAGSKEFEVKVRLREFWVTHAYFYLGVFCLIVCGAGIAFVILRRRIFSYKVVSCAGIAFAFASVFALVMAFQMFALIGMSVWLLVGPTIFASMATYLGGTHETV